MTQEIVGGADLRGRIRDIISNELELAPGELTETGSFIDEYDADSLSLITIITRFEKELGIVLPKDEVAQLVDLNSVYALVQQYTAGEPQSV
ncbi:acyl carrier protein [Kutzneria sp. NPDC052558]|uniref:acyl carrier protein n=1 Tax=Kutzneria sp. NPDC052558 TaxID=3364121 RepID=UPI0037C64AE2